MADAIQVVQALELRALQFTSIHARMERANDENRQNAYDLSLRHAEILEADELRILGVILDFAVHAFHGEAKYIVELALEIGFEIGDRHIDLRDCDEFLEKVVPVTAWPYIRETVHAMGLKLATERPLILPLQRAILRRGDRPGGLSVADGKPAAAQPAPKKPKKGRPSRS